MEEQRFDKYLQRCTVRLKTARSSGTGFFFAPGLILTCAHLIDMKQDIKVSVFWQSENQHYTAVIIDSRNDLGLDFAVLQLVDEQEESMSLNNPCVVLDITEPNIGDNFYTFGYTKDRPEGDSATFEYEGSSFKGGNSLKLKEGQAQPGLSGAPLLNLNTYKVCGIMYRTRYASSDLGGGAVSISAIADLLPEILEQNQQFHQDKGLVQKWKDYSLNKEELATDRDIDYSILKEFLLAEDWFSANDETGKILLKISNRESEERLDIASIRRFPLRDLQTIDRLWTKHSNQRFGLRIQRDIWKSLGGSIHNTPEEAEAIFDQFYKQLEWDRLEKMGDNIFNIPNLIWFGINAFTSLGPPGHYPTWWLQLRPGGKNSDSIEIDDLGDLDFWKEFLAKSLLYSVETGGYDPYHFFFLLLEQL